MHSRSLGNGLKQRVPSIPSLNLSEPDFSLYPEKDPGEARAIRLSAYGACGGERMECRG